MFAEQHDSFMTKCCNVLKFPYILYLDIQGNSYTTLNFLVLNRNTYIYYTQASKSIIHAAYHGVHTKDFPYKVDMSYLGNILFGCCFC
jgi:hypothetical protein